MICRFCGKQLKKMTALHLRSPKCRDIQMEQGNQITRASDYFKQFPEEKDKRPELSFNKSKGFGGLDLLERVDANTLDDEIEVIEEKIGELQHTLKRLRALKKILSGESELGLVVQKLDSSVYSDLKSKIISYLDASGECTLSALSRGLGVSIDVIRPALNWLGEKGSVEIRGDMVRLVK